MGGGNITETTFGRLQQQQGRPSLDMMRLISLPPLDMVANAWMAWGGERRQPAATAVVGV